MQSIPKKTDMNNKKSFMEELEIMSKVNNCTWKYSNFNMWSEEGNQSLTKKKMLIRYKQGIFQQKISLPLKK